MRNLGATQTLEDDEKGRVEAQQLEPTSKHANLIQRSSCADAFNAAPFMNDVQLRSSTGVMHHVPTMTLIAYVQSCPAACQSLRAKYATARLLYSAISSDVVDAPLMRVLYTAMAC